MTKAADSGSSQPDLLAIGEAMYLLEPASGSALVDERTLVAGVAGAEMNTCIAVARTGLSASFCSRVGADPFGERILSVLAAENVDSSFVTVDDSAPTGVFFKEIRPQSDRQVYYYRKGSAASCMSADDTMAAFQVSPRSVFASGISLAIGAGPARATLSVFDEARRRGTASYFDPNLRSSLGGASAITDSLEGVLDSLRGLLIGATEALALFGTSDAGELSEILVQHEIAEILVKKGPHGCDWWADNLFGSVPSLPVDVVDPVGAGDAFNGAYIAARLSGAHPDQAVQLGTLFGGMVAAQRGDFEGMPNSDTTSEALSLATQGTLVASQFYESHRYGRAAE